MTKMKNRIECQELVIDSINRIPFLKRFLWDKDVEREDMPCSFFDPQKINEYMGYYWTKDREFTSASMNEILEEAERRGDLC